jgi:hypothetical protein
LTGMPPPAKMVNVGSCFGKGARCYMTLTIDVELPNDLEKFRLPAAVQQRLERLLDQQDSGIQLSEDERKEAEGLVDLADFLSLLRLRSERLVK